MQILSFFGYTVHCHCNFQVSPNEQDVLSINSKLCVTQTNIAIGITGIHDGKIS